MAHNVILRVKSAGSRKDGNLHAAIEDDIAGSGLSWHIIAVAPDDSYIDGCLSGSPNALVVDKTTAPANMQPYTTKAYTLAVNHIPHPNDASLVYRSKDMTTKEVCH